MSYQTYRVSLMDPSTYQLDIVACSSSEAESIAKSVFMEALTEQPGFSLEGRKVPNAVAVLAPSQPKRQFKVRFQSITEHQIEVPAVSAEDAVVHVKRVVAECDGLVFDFDIVDARLGSFQATEVVS